MKKYYYLFATLLVCLPIACNKINEQEENPQTPTITYIRANGNEDGTKGSVDGTSAAFTWNTGDQIAVWADGYKISNALAVEDDGKSTVDFGFDDLTDNNRDYFAIFPAALVSGIASGHTAASLKLNLPASYTLAEVENEVSPTPMIASNAPGGSLSFKALCPLLRVTVNNIPKQTKRIEFDFNGNKVQGEFTLTGVTPGETAIATSSIDEEENPMEDIITVTMAGNTDWHDYLVINLPVPTGTYGNITITAKDENGLPVLTLTKAIKAAGWTPTRKSSRKMTATLPVFSIGEKKVTIAPGNLQYQASTNTWRFAEHQYDYVGTGGGHISRTYSGVTFEMDNFGNVTGSNNNLIAEDYSGWIDLFGWGTSGWPNSGDDSSNDPTWIYYQPWSSSKAEEGPDNNKCNYGPAYNATNPNLVDNNANGDWGVFNQIGDYPKNTWRTWLQDEFISIKDRTTSTSGFAKGYDKDKASYVPATVNGVKGLILFPDVYTQPADAVPTLANGLSFNFLSFYSSFVVDDTAWSKMESAGAVFLPAAGDRYGKNTRYFYAHIAPYGEYWTATSYPSSNGRSGHWIRFSLYTVQGTHYQKTIVDTATGDVRAFGGSVRLIRDLN